MKKYICVMIIPKYKGNILAYRKKYPDECYSKYMLPTIIIGSFNYPNMNTYICNEMQKKNITIGKSGKKYGPYKVEYENAIYNYLAIEYDVLQNKASNSQELEYRSIPKYFFDSRFFIGILEPMFIDYYHMYSDIASIASSAFSEYYFLMNKDLYNETRKLIIYTRRKTVCTDIENVNQMISYYFKINKDYFFKKNKKAIKEFIVNIWYDTEVLADGF